MIIILPSPTQDRPLMPLKYTTSPQRLAMPQHTNPTNIHLNSSLYSFRVMR